MRNTIAIGLIALTLGFGAGKTVDIPTFSTAEVAVADSSYSLDLHKNIAATNDSFCFRDSVWPIECMHPLSAYTYNPYPNGDVDWNNRLNVLDLNFMIKYVFFGDSLPVRPEQ